jgi:hypothetical protein
VESGGPSVGNVEECDVESQHLQACSSRLCQLRTNGLAPVSKYWMYWSHARVMGSVSLVAHRQLMLGFAPTASTDVLGQKLGMDPWIGQSWCWGSGQEPIFSGAVALLNSVDDYMKCCYAQTTWDTYGRGSYVDRVWDACGMLDNFPLQGVHRFELLRLSDMSTSCLWPSTRRYLNGINGGS